MSKNNGEILIEIVRDNTKNMDTLDSPQPNRAGSNVRGEPRTLGKMKPLTAAEDRKADKVRAERKEASRMVSLANKRLRRLEEKGYTNSPAYKATDGYFSVRGKNQAEVQKMMREMDKFINATTSTIRGTNAYAKEIAANTGVKYDNLKQLQKMIPKFFELSSKVEQYLRNVEDMASAIDYNQIWEQVNVYVQENKVDLSQAKGDIDGMIEHVANALKEYETTETVNNVTFRLKK